MQSSKYELKKDEKYNFLKIHPTPSDEEIAQYYANEFYSSQYGSLNDSSVTVQIRDKEYYDSRWSDMHETVSEIIGDLKDKNILDVGCGWGQALLFFKEKGLNCFGFDPAKDAVDFARKLGLNVECTDMKTADVFKKKMDIVMLVNVLEHLSDPEKIIKEIREKIITTNGVLVIDVPNEFNTFQKIANAEFNLKDWWVIPPAHLNYFDPDSLKKLLEGSGFEVKLVESSFPLEMFMLLGDVYVGNGVLGRQCHEKRMHFEKLMRKHGETKKLRAFYKSLAELGLGRQIVAYATVKR